jgi:DNA polymerase-2
MTQPHLQKCFLLTHECRDTPNGFVIELYAQNTDALPVHIVISGFRPLFFVPRSLPPELTATAAERKELTLATMSGVPVDCCYFKKQATMRECAQNLQARSYTIYESDIHPVDRFLMERNVTGSFEAEGTVEHQGTMLQHMVNPRIRGAFMQPRLSVLSLDIETNVAAGTLYSIASAGKTATVFVLGSGPDLQGVVYCPSEKNLLQQFFRHLSHEDPDILIGWNLIDFDLKFIFERCRSLGVPFVTGRGGKTGTVFTARSGNHSIARISGRVVIDVPVLLRTYYPAFEEYSLNFVANALLGKEKEITLSGKEKIAEIDRLYAGDIEAFARYNLQDALLTREIFDATATLPNAIERSRRSGHLLDRAGGSIAAFDYLYLPRLHRAGYVAPNADVNRGYDIALPGGYVIEPKPAIYRNVLVLDFRSLYPSIIMSFAIDPLGAYLAALGSGSSIQGPAGPPFARSPAILPGIITELLQARQEAKQAKNGPLSQAIKILMNSFYGVLGARNCRFFSAELATCITQTGQYILKHSIEFITETLGYPVIYGDTDSLFVHLGEGHTDDADGIGQSIADKVTAFLKQHCDEQFSAASALLLQYETCFHYLLIPSVRGASHGSKKHYCGGTMENGTLTLSFKGMESARSDWTDLAKEFQQELIRCVFTGKPVEEYILRTVAEVTGGRADGKLIYRKRLRKHHDDYTQSIPPHVQAARQLENPPRLVRYYITVDGPQPVEQLRSPIDYQHYVDCQLQPVADSVLELSGRSFLGIFRDSRIFSGGDGIRTDPVIIPIKKRGQGVSRLISF